MNTQSSTVENTDTATASGGDDPSEVHHYWCCDPDVAFCGYDLSEYEDSEGAPESDLCVVCHNMWESLEDPKACVSTCPAVRS